MVTKSLLTRIYLIAVLGFLLTALVGKNVVDRVMEFGRRSGVERQFSRHVAEIVALAGEEMGESVRDGRPDRVRMEKLSRMLNHRMQWIPWSAKGRYPAALATKPVILDPLLEKGPGFGPGPGGPAAHKHWVRVDHAGKPVGALVLSPARFDRRHHEPPPLFSTLAIVGLIMPAVIWIPATLWLIVRPLRQMKDTAHRLGAGDLESPVTVDRHDEFGELQQAFETMRAKIRRMLVEREQLLTDISHELRGPLSRLSLALPLLAQHSGDEATAKLAQREVATMDSLIGEILSLFRSQSQQMVHESVDLADLAAEVIDERVLVADARKLTITTDLQPAPIRGDAKLVARAISNLLDNALKYTGEGGTIHVETHAAGMAVCRITDDGPGIAPEHLAHIWEPFYRPDSSRSRETGGTGLGLSIVQAIIERHGGTALLDSAPGKGTAAIIHLPLAARTGMLPPLSNPADQGSADPRV